MTKIKNIQKNTNGFSLVELLVSVAITAIILVGMSMFFTSGFQNIFQSQQQVANSQGLFNLSSILQKKLLNVETVSQMGGENEFVLLKNNSKEEGFSYIGMEGDQLVVKDFFIFNGQEGALSSIDDVSGINNPGGITKLNSKYYVTAPSENLIYECNNLNNCNTTLNLSDLKNPIDVTNDGQHLYVSDAGNNRVLLIQDPGGANDTKEIMTGLNFPTGLEYYSDDNGEFLFVSDSLNNVVKRMNLNNSEINIVAGGGQNQTCEMSTAEFCALNFPTGLTVRSKDGLESLYISDTGNERVLRVFEPSTDLTEVELPLKFENSTEISHIDFEFPKGTIINSMEETGSENSLNQPGRYSISNNVVSYLLDAQTIQNQIELFCVGEGEDKECVSLFRGFFVNNESNIFKEGNSITVGENNFDVQNVTFQWGSWNIMVNPDTEEINPPLGTTVRITDNFSGSHAFPFDMTDIVFTPGFNQITTQAFDEENQQQNQSSDQIFLRIPDGSIGSSEDIIEVVATALDYPTGIGWSGNSPIFSEVAQYNSNFTEFDYKSDVQINQFNAATKNDGSILEITFSALKAVDQEGEPLYQSHTLNASLEK